jgi:hypothetical protein
VGGRSSPQKAQRLRSLLSGKMLASFLSEYVFHTNVFSQVRPTLRMHMPGQPSCVARHTDYIYHRQPTETNVWIPLTAVGGTNSLWSESEPQRQDFAPFETDGFGTAVLFWGNQCEHYSVPNTTDTTRVSLDLRVIRADLFVADYIAPENRCSCSRSCSSFSLFVA